MRHWLPEPAKEFARRTSALTFYRWQCVRQSGDAPRVTILPSEEARAASSYLRGYALAPWLRKLGWRVSVVPPFVGLDGRRRLLADERPDVLLMQQTRHALNRAGLYDVPYVFDADDADYLDPRHRDDVAACAAAAAAVVAGSRYVADLLRGFGPKPEVIWTTTPPTEPKEQLPNEGRRPIVAWAHACPLGEVFAREAALVQDAIRRAAAGRSFEFWLFGTEPGPVAEAYLAPLRAAGVLCRTLPWMSYQRYLDRLGEVAVGLQPVCIETDHSRGRSFGKILGYLQRQVAVVASNAVDHPLFFRHGENGMLAGDAEEWAVAIATLLDDPARRADLAVRGYADYRARLTTERGAVLYDRVLRRILAAR